MRAALLMTLAALVAAPAAAQAAPVPDVQVAIGPELQRDAVERYGERDVSQLAASLRRDVQRALGRSGVLRPDDRVELILKDARPNRPTYQQLGATPGLSPAFSYGAGGAAIEGQVIAADGAITPLKYQWYEYDIHRGWTRTTWADAEQAFDFFAARLAKGPQAVRD